MKILNAGWLISVILCGWYACTSRLRRSPVISSATHSASGPGRPCSVGRTPSNSVELLRARHDRSRNPGTGPVEHGDRSPPEGW
jgi:hypothetical protein